MEYKETHSEGGLRFFLFILGVAVVTTIYDVFDVEERAIKDYILHPDKYELRYTYIKGDSNFVDLTVIKK